MSSDPTDPLVRRDVPTELPPVEPPSARFIVQLFVIPAAIVLVLVVAYLAFVQLPFGRLANGGRDVMDYVRSIKSTNEHRRWRSAQDLANLINNDAGARQGLATARRADEPLPRGVGPPGQGQARAGRLPRPGPRPVQDAQGRTDRRAGARPRGRAGRRPGRRPAVGRPRGGRQQPGEPGGPHPRQGPSAGPPCRPWSRRRPRRPRSPRPGVLRPGLLHAPDAGAAACEPASTRTRPSSSATTRPSP